MGFERKKWIDHLKEVHAHPERFTKPADTKLSIWIIESWKMIQELRRHIEQDLKSTLKEEPAFQAIMIVYRKYDEHYHEIYQYLRREFSRKENMFPLVRGGLLVPELTNMDMSLRQRKVGLRTAADSLEVCRRINQELDWHCPDVDKQIKKIEKYINVCIVSSLE